MEPGGSLNSQDLFFTQAYILGKKAINDWTHVILDEVHEREEDMDFLLVLCRRFLNTNSRGTKLILMSATIEIDKFCEYFSRPIKINNIGMDLLNCIFFFKY